MTEERLIQILDEQFTRRFKEQDEKIEQKFAEVSAEFRREFVSEDQFARLYNYMEERFNRLEAKIDGLEDSKADKNQLDRLILVVESLAKRNEVHADKQARVNHRYETWIGQLADNTHTKLVPGQ